MGLPDIEIEALTFFMNFESKLFTKLFNIIKVSFSCISLINFVYFRNKLKQFQRSDLGWVQKWIFLMNLLLIFFNDPFCYWKEDLGIAYPIWQSMMESLLISSLLFFWLLLVHAIAYQDLVISIDPTSFFLPKAVISCTFLVYLVIMRLFVYVRYS